MLKRIVILILGVLAGLFLLSSSTALAQAIWGDYSFTWVDHGDNPRFAIYDVEGDNAGGEAYYAEDLVLDKKTGLVWARDANLAGGTKTWRNAIDYCRDFVQLADRKGWRLPAVEELSSLIDPSQVNPKLPINHPFLNVQLTTPYWSSTTMNIWPNNAWNVRVGDSLVNYDNKPNYNYVWPVRGGNGYASGNW